MTISFQEKAKINEVSQTQKMLSPEEKIYQLLVERDEVSWRDLLLDIVKAEGMDPWDIDVGLLARKYLTTVKKLKEMDFRVSGKVVLAAALLLSFKSKRLFGEELDKLDELISMANQEEEEYFMEGIRDFFSSQELELPTSHGNVQEETPPKINLRTPQPRTRKLTVMDLVEALEQAMKVKQRRQNRISMQEQTAPKIPVKKFDLKAAAIQVYTTITSLFKKKKKVYFDDIIKSPNKEDIVSSFIPLLHLDFSRVLHLVQQESFGKIEIELLKKTKNEEEIASSIKL